MPPIIAVTNCGQENITDNICTCFDGISGKILRSAGTVSHNTAHFAAAPSTTPVTRIPVPFNSLKKNQAATAITALPNAIAGTIKGTGVIPSKAASIEEITPHVTPDQALTLAAAKISTRLTKEPVIS